MSTEEEIYQKLKNAIIKRYIKSGNKLVEETIAQKLGVSRTPVRAAMRRLANDGLLTIMPKRGAVVISPTIAEIEQTYEVRIEMEKMAVRKAAENITEKQLKKLDEIIQKEIEIFKADNIEDYNENNEAFHLLIAEASGNKVLYRYIDQLLEKMKIYLILYDPFFKLKRHFISSEHRPIVEALEEKNAERAVLEMEEHLTAAFEQLDTSEVLPPDYFSL